MEPNVLEAVERIYKLKIENDTTISELISMFYDICREFNIKKGIPSYTEDGARVGSICNTTEWSILKDVFKSKISDYFDFWDLFEPIPEDLEL